MSPNDTTLLAAFEVPALVQRIKVKERRSNNESKNIMNVRVDLQCFLMYERVVSV